MKIYVHSRDQEKADLMKGKLSREGHTVITPFDIYPEEKRLEVLFTCDALYLLEEEDILKNLMSSLIGKKIYENNY